jgi:predicted Zn-dependent protease
LYLSRQYDRALEDLNKALELNPNDVAAHIYRGQVYLQRGNKKQAITEFLNAKQVEGDKGVAFAILAQAYALVGERSRAKEMLAILEERAKQSYVSPTEIGFTYAAPARKGQGIRVVGESLCTT